MPALNFKKEFAGRVKSGEKCQTIRAYRKDGRNPRPGQVLYLYTGMRTKDCQKLGEAICKTVTPICFENNGYLISITVGAASLSEKDVLRLAKADGFKNIEIFFEFFSKTHGFPFYGLLIKW